MAGSNPQLAIRIAANLDELKRNLAEGKASIEALGPSVAKMAATWNQHSAKLIQDAHNITAAVQQVGASTLTAADAARNLRTLDAAMEHMKATGQGIPPLMQQTADKMRAVGSSAGGMSGALGKVTGLLGAFGVAVSVGAVVSFGKRVFDTASNIHDMSLKLGISTDAVQGFKFAAEQSGASLESVGTAINKMNMNLAGGDKATVQALKDAGLEFNTIRALKPEDAFLAIADAVQRIPDPMLQADIAMQLFGKGAADLLPGMKEGFRSAADAAEKMSADTIKALEAAQDAWGKLADWVTIKTGTIIAHSMSAAQGITSSWKAFGMFVENTIKFGAGAAAAMADAQNAAATAGERSKDVHLSLHPVIHKTAEQIAAEEQALKKAADAAKKHAEALKEIMAAQIPLTTAQILQVLAMDKASISASLMAEKLGVSAIAIQHYLGLVKDSAKATDEWKKAQDALRAAIGTAMTVSPLTSLPGAELEDQTAAILKNVNIQQKAYEDAATANAKRTMSSYDFQRFQIAQWVRDEKAKIDQSVAGWQGAFDAIDKAGAEKFKSLTASITVDLGALSQSLANLAQISGGTFGAIASGFATMVGSLDAARKAADVFKAGLAAAKSGEALAGIAGMASGIAGIVAAAVAAAQAIKAIWGALDRNKGRDVVVDFAESMGGFDELHNQLLALGDAGEALWVKLTQGVGRNNPEQAAKVVAEVEAALAKQAAAAAAASVETEAGAQATIETAAQAALALDELNGRLATNAEAWGAWSEDVTGFLQNLATNIRSMPLPGAGGVVNGGAQASGGDYLVTRPTLFLAGEAGPERATFTPRVESTRGSGGGDTYITLVMPDGEVLLKQVVKAASRGGY